MHADPVAAEEVLHLLDDDTRRRLPARRRDVAASAHALLRCVLSGLTGIPAPDQVFTRSCATCGGLHGKPLLVSAALHTSLAYASGAVVVAVTAADAVGVDVEDAAATDFAGFDGSPSRPASRRGRCRSGPAPGPARRRC